MCIDIKAVTFWPYAEWFLLALPLQGMKAMEGI